MQLCSIVVVIKTGYVIIDILVYDGTDDLDAFGPLEVLRSAATFGVDVVTRLVTWRPQTVVTTAHNVRFETDGLLGDPACDVLLVTGGSWGLRADVGAWGEFQRGEILGPIAQASSAASLTGGICTGTMLLAHAGVVGTRRASTHRSALDDLAETGARVVAQRVVDDGDLVTSGGVTSGIDLALWLVQRLGSVDVANAVANRMEYERFIPKA